MPGSVGLLATILEVVSQLKSRGRGSREMKSGRYVPIRKKHLTRRNIFGVRIAEFASVKSTQTGEMKSRGLGEGLGKLKRKFDAFRF